MDEEAARARATELAANKFKTTTLRDAEGKIVQVPKVTPDEFRLRHEHRRWILNFGGPAGPWANVSFDEDGSNPSVEVGFAAD